jgi:hypothetical protein
MGSKSEFSRVLTKGGVLTPSYLSDIVRVAEIAGNDSVLLGSRQDILFKQDENSELKIIQLKPDKFQLFDREFAFQNIVSSLVSTDILPSTEWVRDETYHSIFDQIQFKHTIRINIVDPKQDLVPLFSGNLNFIASLTPGYWFLYLKKNDQEDAKKWPGLIATNDIASLAFNLEKIWNLTKDLSLDDLSWEMSNTLQIHSMRSDEELNLPKDFFPSYEGLEKTKRNDSNWIDFYCQNNRYKIKFLREVIELCEQTGQDKIYLTPWKTFLIKGISQQNKELWKALIERSCLNKNNSLLELNWRLPLHDKKAYNLKRFIVDSFDKLDLKNFQLSLTIQTKPMDVYTAAIIRVDRGVKLPGFLEFIRTYSIYFASEVNTSNSKYILFEQNISKYELPQKIEELNNRYFSGNIYKGRETWEPLTKNRSRQSLAY